MKKVKELLCFIVPIFTLLTCIYFLFPNSEFLSREQYIKLSFQSSFFRKALLQGYIWPCVCAISVFVIAFLIKIIFAKRIKLRRIVFYIGAFAISSLCTFVCVVVTQVNRWIIPSLQSYRPFSISASDILAPILISILAAFVVWIIESVIEVIKKKN